MIAYEKECKRINRELGLTKAVTAASRSTGRCHEIIDEISDIKALTLDGMAHKAALLSRYVKLGYGGSDQKLALSIAEDARMLGTGGWPEHPVPEWRSPRRSRVSRDCSLQAAAG